MLLQYCIPRNIYFLQRIGQFIPFSSKMQWLLPQSHNDTPPILLPPHFMI